MGTCKYCGQSAGFLKSEHTECVSKHNTGLITITKNISDAIQKESDFSFLDKEIAFIQKENFINENDKLKCFIDAFDQTVVLFLDDGILTEKEEELVTRFNEYYNIEKESIDKHGSVQKIVKASILRDLREGKTPTSRLNITGTLPFILQKSELLIWVFQNVGCCEQRTKTTYEGRSSGVSFRIAKGVYYRTGAFKGNPVQVNEMRAIGIGLFAVTNKNLYFSSSIKSFKIPIDKILTLNPYEDGIGIQKDGASSKPLIFTDLDSWFVYNLISILTQS
jgi:hypothetical protein